MALSMSFPRLGILAGVLLVTSACSSVGHSLAGMVSPYRPDIRQGNYIDGSALERLRVGMSRDQVRYLLGSPLVLDLFDPDRWAYVYRFQPGDGPVVQRKISIRFADGKVAEIDDEGFEATAAVEVPTAGEPAPAH